MYGNAESGPGGFGRWRSTGCGRRGGLRNLQLRRLTRRIAQRDAHFLNLEVERRDLRGCAISVALSSLAQRFLQPGEGDGKFVQLEVR